MSKQTESDKVGLPDPNIPIIEEMFTWSDPETSLEVAYNLHLRFDEWYTAYAFVRDSGENIGTIEFRIHREDSPLYGLVEYPKVDGGGAQGVGMFARYQEYVAEYLVQLGCSRSRITPGSPEAEAFCASTGWYPEEGTDFFYKDLA